MGLYGVSEDDLPTLSEAMLGEMECVGVYGRR